MLHLGRDSTHLLIQPPHFTNGKRELGVGLVPFMAMIKVFWFSPEWDHHWDMLPLVGYDLLPLLPPTAP